MTGSREDVILCSRCEQPSTIDNFPRHFSSLKDKIPKKKWKSKIKICFDCTNNLTCFTCKKHIPNWKFHMKTLSRYPKCPTNCEECPRIKKNDQHFLSSGSGKELSIENETCETEKTLQLEKGSMCDIDSNDDLVPDMISMPQIALESKREPTQADLNLSNEKVFGMLEMVLKEMKDQTNEMKKLNQRNMELQKQLLDETALKVKYQQKFKDAAKRFNDMKKKYVSEVEDYVFNPAEKIYEKRSHKR